MTDQIDTVSVVTGAEPPPVTAESIEAALKGSSNKDVPPVEEAKPETEGEQAAAESADAPDGETEGEEQSGGEPKPKKGYFAKRIGELTWQAKEAERRAESLAQEVERLKAAPPAQQALTEPEPDVNDTAKYPAGEFDPKYMRDLGRHVARQEFAAERQRIEQEGRQREAQQVRAAFEAKLTEKDEGAFRLLNDPSLPATEAMAEVVFTSDKGVQIADWLGRNPSECARIAALSPIRQAHELGKLEARLTAPPPVSKAPAPIPTVGTRAHAAFNPETATQAEYEAWRDEQEKARKRA